MAEMGLSELYLAKRKFFKVVMIIFKVSWSALSALLIKKQS